MSRMMMDFVPAYSPTMPQPLPAMWKRGMHTRFTSSGVQTSPHSRVAEGKSAKKLLFVSIAPFGWPVVPLVYIWMATSSPPIGTCGSVVGWASRQAG